MTSIDNKKVKQIFETGKKLFWKHGIKRISVEEICMEAGVSKMTFYKYFKNKHELVKFILSKIYDDAMKKYRNIMDSNIPFKEKVKRTIDFKLEQSNDISAEFYDDYMRNATPELKEFFNKKVQENLMIIMSDYVEAQKQGDIRKDINPQFILYFLNHMMEMGKDKQLEKIYPNPQDLIMEMTNFFFYGVLPRDND